MAAPTFQSISGHYFTSGVGNAITPVWPTHASGDIALLYVETANEDFEFLDRAGFAKMPGSPQGTGVTPGAAVSVRLSIYWCRATSATMRSPVIQAPLVDHISAAIIVVRGCIQTGNPWDLTGIGYNMVSSGTAVSIPGATTSVADCFVVLAVANATDTASAQTSGYSNANFAVTERFDANTTSGLGGGFALATGVAASAGLFPNSPATLATDSAQARYTVALKPAVAVVPNLFAFLTLQDPDNPDSEMTFKVTSFREESPTWSGERTRAFAGNWLDSRHDRKRAFRASVDIHTPAEVGAFEDFIDLGPDATTGQFLGPRPVLMRSDTLGAIRLESFVEVEVTVESLAPIENLDGGWVAELTLEET